MSYSKTRRIQKARETLAKEQERAEPQPVRFTDHLKQAVTVAQAEVDRRQELLDRINAVEGGEELAQQIFETVLGAVQPPAPQAQGRRG